MHEGSETVVRCAVGTTESFKVKDQTTPGINVKSVPVCSDNGQADGRSKEKTTVDDAVC